MKTLAAALLGMVMWMWRIGRCFGSALRGLRWRIVGMTRRGLRGSDGADQSKDKRNMSYSLS